MPDFYYDLDGWVSVVPGPDHPERIHARVQDQGGRLVITDLYIHAPEITGEIVRGISVSRLQAMINAARQFTEVVEHVAATPPREPSLAELRQRLPVAAAEAPQRSRLTRPGSVAPEEFYPLIAQAYLEYAARTRAPAKEIATEAGVPVSTAHRWVLEARRRGFLAPAAKGKTG